MKKIIGLLGVLFVLGCTPKKVENFPVKDAILGWVKPVNLNLDSTQFFLSDYFLYPDSVDSVVCPQGLNFENTETESWLLGSIGQEFENLKVYYNGYRYDIPVKRTKERRLVFTYEPKGNQPTSVKLRGTMNSWNALNNILVEENGLWRTTLTAKEGKHQYLLVINDRETVDPTNPDSVDNGMGGYNSVLKVGNQSGNLKMYTSKFENGKLMLWHNGISNFLAYWNNHLIPTDDISNSQEFTSITLPAEAVNYESSYLKIYGFTENGSSNDLFIKLNNGIPVKSTKELTRHDKHTMIMYFMMVDRFMNGNPSNDEPLNHPDVHPKADYYGGDIDGITTKVLDNYFSDLGVNTIWLSPISQNPKGPYGQYPNPPTKFSGYHGYWPISSSKIDYRFGTEEGFNKLLNEAHTRELNVLVDYVANHVHEEHPVYKNNPDWATSLYLPDGTMNTEKWDEYRLTTWFDVFMPTLNFFKPEVVEAMTDSALFWFKNYPIDGFRHDATKHIPEDFWRTLTYKLKTQIVHPENRNIYQIGETYGSADLINSYINTGMLDGQFDFNVYDAAVSAFARPDIGFKGLSEKLSESLSIYGYHNLMGNITGNQDRPRFISYADGSLRFGEDTKLAGWTRSIEIQDTVAYKKLQMLHAFNLTIPGIPVIYYADEYGVPGGNDPDNRRMMAFDGWNKFETETRNHVKKLCDLRSNNLALIYGDLNYLIANDSVMAYTRKYFNEEVLIVFNKSDQAAEFSLSKPEYFSNQNFTDAISKTKINWEQSFKLLPNTYQIIVNED